jgi:hypothetical protein
MDDVFVLAEENAIDREEIEDIITEFDALLGRSVKYAVETLISKDKPLATEPATPIAFLRRED